ncbi:putative membrane protein [Caulobacter ginsengisoli]|uniref:Membrane protein n=1 Tax=Caulobacter ginsengisoli TaxID=400775 RepID=A0ABU0IST3_9CAUL|nr:DUF998 domain-containing protein [Caulobacter ginsengisoli]MDQ0465071.1 putative membrane protein [Caulobacter ginsengisoli]
MTPRFRRRRLMLAVGMAAPVVAFIAVVLATLSWPDYDQSRQYLSELGGLHAPAPWLFNSMVVFAGVSAAVAGVGFALALLALDGSRWAAGVTAAAFILAGVGMVVAGLIPWPDPRHRLVNLGLFIMFAPLCLIWGLARVREMRRLRWFLALVFIAMAVLTVLTRHLVFKGLVNDFNVGWWERGFALVLIGWTGVAAWALERRLVALSRGQA